MAQEEERVKIIFDTNAAKAASDSNKLADAIGNVDDSADSAKKSMKDLDASFDEVYEGMKPLTARMGEAEDRLYELALAGETTSKEYEGLLQKVAEYRRTQIETDRVVDAAATTLGQKLGGAAQIAATGVQGITAGMALFGDQSEETEKALLKVQAAMAFADSISQISTLGGQFRVLKDVVKDTFSKIVAAKAAEKAATDAGTASQLRQNLAVLANPYVIAAAAVAALSIGVYAWAKANGEAAKREEEVTKSVAKNSLATKDLARSIEEAKSSTQSSNEIEILRARAYGKTDAEIQKLIKSQKDLGVQQAAQMRMEAFNNYARAEADYYKALKTDNEEVIKSAKENLNESFEIFKSAQQEKREAEREQVKFFLETKISENEKLKQIEEKRTATEKDEAKKRAEIAKEEAEKKKQQREEDQKALNEFQIKSFEAKIQNALLEAEQEAENRKAITDQIDAIELERAERQKAIEEGILEQKKFIEAKKTEIAENGIRLLANIFGKSKTVQKAAIIAENAIGIGKQIIANNTANAGALATPQAIATSGAAAAPVIALNNISTGIGIASTIAATAKALSAVGGGSASGGGGTVGAGTVRSATPPTVAFNNSAENQIGQSVARVQTEQPPLKVFVAESDISKAQNNVKVLENKNSF